MNQTGYAVLKIPKTGAAFAYAKEARDFATGATGAGGYLNASATTSAWTDVQFVSVIGTGYAILPISIGGTETNIYTGSATVIGGTTPIGDLRSESGPYVNVGGSNLYNTEKDQEYKAAFYATYIGGTNSSPTKIGIGTTAGDISTSGYYEGSFTTNNIHEFQTSFTADSTDLSKITTGSGVYTEGADVTLQFNILNRNGEQLASAAQIAADPFVSGQKISILNTDGTVAFSDYRIGGDSTFTFSSSQNIDVFGSFTRNFGIRNQVVNQDGEVHTSEFYLYANTATFNKVFVRSSGQTVLNETYSNHNPPNTGSITAAADRADAIKYFNNQPINDSGVTGFIEFDLGFNESPNFTSLGDVVLFHGTGEDFTTNRGSLVGNFPLNSVQEGQRIRLTANDGIPEGTGLFFKLAADTEVGFNEELFTVGPFTLEPTVEGPDLNLYNQGDQSLVGDFTIEGGLEGDDANGGNLNVSGNALGTGIGGRLTGPESKMYLLSGDAGTESDTLQSVTARGNTVTDLDVDFNDATLYISHTDQRVGIGTNYPRKQLEVVGDSLFGGNVGIGTINPTQKLDVDGITTSKGFQTNTTNTNYNLISRNSAGNPPLYVQSANSNTDQPIAFFSYGSATANAGTKILKVGKDESYFDNTNVGIGSTTPTVALDVAGAGKFTSQVTIPATPSASTDAASKGYVDAQVGSADTLQEVTENGNTTDQGIEVTAGGIKVNDYLTHYGDTDTYLGFPSNNNFELYTAGGSALAIDPSQNIYFRKNVGIGSNGSSPQKLFVQGNSVEVKIATSDGYSIKTEQKAVIGGVESYIFSTGSAILGGSGHHVSGDYDTIAGGTLNNISGGNFNFIGGGSQVDITGSQYSSSVGGRNNDILNSNHSTIGGGVNNKIENAFSSVIAGGETNEVHDPVSAIVGGNSHIISGGNGYSFIGGGEANEVHGTFSSVLGGEGNKVYGSDSVTLGGWFTESSGRFALVGPGEASKVSGDYAVALGNKVEIPVAHTGATVLADGQDRVHASSGMHTATLDFASGVYVPTIGYFGEGLHVSGVPVLTGENNPAEADTLQTVTTRGNETTTSIISTGPYISGVTGLFSDKVGIGTVSPVSKLEVSQQLSATSTIDYPYTISSRDDGNSINQVGGEGVGIKFRIAGNDSTTPSNSLVGASIAAIRESSADTNSSTALGFFVTQNDETLDEAVRIDSDGNVGIGTTSPSTKLHVYEAVNRTTAIVQNNNHTARFEAFGTATAIDTTASNGVFIRYNGSNRVHFAAGGNVGIGIDSPVKNLTVAYAQTSTDRNNTLSGATAGNGLLIHNSSTAVGSYANLDFRAGSADARILYEYDAANQGGFHFITDNATSFGTKLYIADAGNVGIGETSVDARLHVTSLVSAGISNVKLESTGASKWAFGIPASQTYFALDDTNDNLTTPKLVVLKTSGNVGIGTAGPTSILEVLQTVANGDGAQLRVINDGSAIGSSQTASLVLGRNFGERNWKLTSSSTASYGVNPDLIFTTTKDGVENLERLRITNAGNVGIGTTSPSNALDVVGHFSATSKSFLIDHPTKENKKLQYASLEGPENGVYVRGTTDKETIELPEYWSELVHEDSITVVLTPIGKKQDLFIKEKSNKLIKIGGAEGSFDYVVYGERKDIDKLEIEPLKV